MLAPAGSLPAATGSLQWIAATAIRVKIFHSACYCIRPKPSDVDCGYLKWKMSHCFPAWFPVHLMKVPIRWLIGSSKIHSLLLSGIWFFLNLLSLDIMWSRATRCSPTNHGSKPPRLGLAVVVPFFGNILIYQSSEEIRNMSTEKFGWGHFWMSLFCWLMSQTSVALNPAQLLYRMLKMQFLTSHVGKTSTLHQFTWR